MAQENALRLKLIEFVNQTGVNLTEKEQIELANEYYRMIIGWIEEPSHQRDAFLAGESQRIISRFAVKSKVYSMQLVGHLNNRSPEHAELKKHASHFFHRYAKTVQKLFDRDEHKRFGPRSELIAPSISFKSIEPHGDSFKIKADITIQPVPEKIMRRAKERTKRKGGLKISQFSLYSEQLSFQADGFIREKEEMSA